MPTPPIIPGPAAGAKANAASASAASGASARPGPAPRDLTRPAELRRTLSDDGSEYLAILIRKPVADDEIAAIEWLLDVIDPGHGWIHVSRKAA